MALFEYTYSKYPYQIFKDIIHEFVSDNAVKFSKLKYMELPENRKDRTIALKELEKLKSIKTLIIDTSFTEKNSYTNPNIIYKFSKINFISLDDFDRINIQHIDNNSIYYKNFFINLFKNSKIKYIQFIHSYLLMFDEIIQQAFLENNTLEVIHVDDHYLYEKTCLDTIQEMLNNNNNSLCAFIAPINLYFRKKDHNNRYTIGEILYPEFVRCN